ncbi:MAG: VTC domain-containing protein, partial [Propionibacteriaceae bacterium]|nr:VTC domain-containing protein [Propionibacteriaceae bacterium]
MTVTAGAIHAFNRFEIKYLANPDQVERLRVELDRAMAPDPNSGPEGYRVESVYYDSPGLRVYWEKIDGLRFRRKLRLRRYGASPAQDTSPVFVEVKQRVNRVTQKRRLSLPYAAARRLCSGQTVELPAAATLAQTRLADEIVELCLIERLRPMVTTCYQRQAYL